MAPNEPTHFQESTTPGWMSAGGGSSPGFVTEMLGRMGGVCAAVRPHKHAAARRARRMNFVMAGGLGEARSGWVREKARMQDVEKDQRSDVTASYRSGRMNEPFSFAGFSTSTGAP